MIFTVEIIICTIKWSSVKYRIRVNILYIPYITSIIYKENWKYYKFKTQNSHNLNTNLQ